MKTAYKDGIILDGTKEMTARRGETVIVENGRITDILPSGGLLPSDCEIVNLNGCYLMPGLINLHVHLNSGGRPSSKKKEPEDYVRLVKLATSNPVTREMACAMIRGYAYTQLESGVTTIRTVGGMSNFDGRIRNEIEEGVRKRVKSGTSGSGRPGGLHSTIRAARTGMTRIPLGPGMPDGIGALVRGGTAGSAMPGPRILTSNTGISVPGGHVAGSLAYPVYFAEEAAEYVAKIAKDRPDLIKLMVTGGIMDAEREGEPGVLKTAAELWSPKTGIMMTVLTTMPGLQLYTGGAMSSRRGEGGAALAPGAGLCLETQFYPDSPNRPEFPSALLRAGEKYEHVTIWRFSVK